MKRGGRFAQSVKDSWRISSVERQRRIRVLKLDIAAKDRAGGRRGWLVEGERGMICGSEGRGGAGQDEKRESKERLAG